MNSKNLTPESIFKSMVRLLYIGSNQTNERYTVDGIYRLTVQTITNTLEKNLEKGNCDINYYMEMLDVANRTYEILCRPEVKNIITSKELTCEEVVNRYKAEALGITAPEEEKTTTNFQNQNGETQHSKMIQPQTKKVMTTNQAATTQTISQIPKREPVKDISQVRTSSQKMQSHSANIKINGNKQHGIYDIETLYNPNLINKTGQVTIGEFGRDITYKLKIGKRYEFINQQKQKVIIQEIGKLDMVHSINIHDSLTKYRIYVIDGAGSITTRELYSNFSEIIMKNQEYREAVLEGLLGKDNLELSSKTGGYIGEIIKTPDKMKIRNGMEEDITPYYHISKLNDKYSIMHDARYLTATRIHEYYEETKRKVEEISTGRQKSNGEKS